MLEGGAFLDDGFLTWAKDWVLLCHIATQIKGQPNDDLMEKKGGHGFPTVICMDSDGTVIASLSGDRTADTIAKTGEAARKYVSLREKAKKGDEAAGIECLLLEVGFQPLKSADVRARAAKFKSMTDDQKSRLGGKVANLEVWEIFDQGRNKEAGSKYAEMKKAGRIPEDAHAAHFFWLALLEHADKKGDAVLFEEALVAIEKISPGLKAFLDKKRVRLEELKKGAAKKP